MRGLRYSAVIICGVLVGLAGVYLVLSQAAYFQPNMSAGKGFIALAALVFAKWRPWPALATCLLFGFLDALAIRLQGAELPVIGPVPVQAIEALPYVLTVVLLAGFIGKAIPPKASGIPMSKSADPLAELFAAAKAAQANAYAPYSRFRVGAALRTPGRDLFGRQCGERRVPRRLLRRDERHFRHGAGRRTPHRRDLRRRRRRGALHALRRLPPAHPRIRRRGDPRPRRGPEGVRATFRLAALLPKSFGPGHLRNA